MVGALIVRVVEEGEVSGRGGRDEGGGEDGELLG
jgi:hypothetical protein